MKKVFIFIGLLFILYMGLIFWYRFYGEGHNYEYIITTDENEFIINEKFNNIKGNSNYYFKIEIGDETFYYQTFENFYNNSKIIDNIFYYSDEKYRCILPVYTGERIVSDILCKTTNDYIYNYNYLKGFSADLDQFAKSLESVGYKVENWDDNSEKIEDNGVYLYQDNIPKNHYIALTNYKGVLLANSKSKKFNDINLFSSDIYQKKFDLIYENKYIVADYESDFRFHEFYVVDIIDGNKTKIVSSKELSFDCYIQGIVDKKIYFFDKTTKKQYEIDFTTNKIKEVGNEQIGIKIYNGEGWEKASAISASNDNIKFKDEEKPAVKENHGSLKILGSKQYGYNFYYRKIDEQYLVYRSNIQDNEQLTYLFATSNINNIIFMNDYIYYVDGEFIKQYSDKKGVKNIIQYKELKFNENIYFSVYSK